MTTLILSISLVLGVVIAATVLESLRPFAGKVLVDGTAASLSRSEMGRGKDGSSSPLESVSKGNPWEDHSIHYKHSVNTPMFPLQPGEAKCPCFDSFGLAAGRVIVTLHVGSGSSFTRRGEWGCYLAVSEGAQPSIIVEFVFIVVEILKLLKVECVAENGTNATKALDELVAFGGAVGYELEGSTKVAVLLGEPLQHGALIDYFHLLARLLVHEESSVLLLGLGGVEDDLCSLRALQDPAGDFQVLKDDQGFGCTGFQGLERIVNTIADLARIHRDVVEVGVDELLFLDELDIAERLASQLDGLVEAVLASVGHVDNLDDLGLQTIIKQIGLVQVVLEVGRTGENDTGDIDLVSRNKVLYCQLRDLSDIVVALFLSQTGETQGRLTTTAVFLG